MNDPLRRTYRDLRDAAHQCDAWNMILDTTTVLNYDHGLYLACANFNKFIEAADMYCSMVSPDYDLLHLLLPIVLGHACWHVPRSQFLWWHQAFSVRDEVRQLFWKDDRTNKMDQMGQPPNRNGEVFACQWQDIAGVCCDSTGDWSSFISRDIGNFGIVGAAQDQASGCC